MNDNQKMNQGGGRAVTPRPSGFFQDFTDRFRLISRLMVDSRVNPFLKALPIGTLVYALWPLDVPGPFDDMFVIWLGTTLFVQLCPPDVVEEHMRALNGGASPSSSTPTGGSSTASSTSAQWNQSQQPHQQENVIDGEYFETDSHNSNRTSSR